MGDQEEKEQEQNTPAPAAKPDAAPKSPASIFYPASATPPVTSHTFHVARSGPLPDAAEFARYGDVHPDAPSIILEEFQRQGAHRREMERRFVSADIWSERAGLLSALVVTLVGFGCATYLVATGHDVAGTVIFGIDVGALVGTFIYGRHAAKQTTPRDQKK